MSTGSNAGEHRQLGKVIALRRQDRGEREEQQQVLDLYLAALGDI